MGVSALRGSPRRGPRRISASGGKLDWSRRESARRMATVPRAAEVVRGFAVTDRATMVRRGDMS